MTLIQAPRQGRYLSDSVTELVCSAIIAASPAVLALTDDGGSGPSAAPQPFCPQDDVDSSKPREMAWDQLRKSTPRVSGAASRSADLSDKTRELLSQIMAVAGRSRTQGSAGAVSTQTEEVARKFVWALPRNARVAVVDSDSDGNIDLEWAKGPRQIVNVMIDGNGMLYYASLIGTEGRHGRGTFSKVFRTSCLISF